MLILHSRRNCFKGIKSCVLSYNCIWRMLFLPDLPYIFIKITPKYIFYTNIYIYYEYTYKKQINKARAYFESSEEPSKIFGQFQYQADSWSSRRKVIVKAEHNEKGANTRYLVTNMRGTPEEIYNEKYCPRGDMENRIQETQRALFADRVSSMRFAGNQLRMILSAAAYILMNVIFLVILKN